MGGIRDNENGFGISLEGSFAVNVTTSAKYELAEMAGHEKLARYGDPATAITISSLGAIDAYMNETPQNAVEKSWGILGELYGAVVASAAT